MKSMKVLLLSVLVVGCSNGSSTSDEPMEDLGLQVDSITETTDDLSVVEESEALVSSEVDDPIESTPTTNPTQDSGSSTFSFGPTPFEGRFIQETTSLIELFVYEKRNDESNVLIEHTQTQIELITERNQQFIENVDAILFIGLVTEQGELLNEIRDCQVELETQEFVYVARSTDLSGDFVTWVNGDICGSTPGLQFEDIDAQVFFRDLEAIGRALTCSNESNCDQFIEFM